MTTEYLISDLKGDEGLRLKAYPDPLSGAEPYTCGYGHAGPDVTPSTTWTQTQADAALDSDIGVAARALDEHLPWWRDHSDLRQDCMANMCFNMGVGKLEGFHNMLAAWQARDYETAAAEGMDSNWARQVGDSPPSDKWPVGQRAYRLMQQLRTGERAAAASF
jgi:lysozyme